MIYSNNTYDITNDISTYTRTDFKSVYDTSRGKWFMLNNLNAYEEYGIYGDSLNGTYYPGKLVIVNDEEYEWNGAEWDDLGAQVERLVGWTNSEATAFSILYNGSNYVLKATQNDAEMKIFCIEDVSTTGMDFFRSSSQGDHYEYELFYTMAMGTPGHLLFDLGYSYGRRLDAACTWDANTEYDVKVSNGKYLDTKRSIVRNGVTLASSNNLSTSDNTDDKITMNYSTTKYNKEFIIYETTGAVFDIKCKKENGQTILYDALGNGILYNYGTQDPVEVIGVNAITIPKEYDPKAAPTITSLWGSKIFRDSNQMFKLYRNDAEQAKWDYKGGEILKR